MRRWWRRRRKHVDWQKAYRIFLPIMIGVAYLSIGSSAALRPDIPDGDRWWVFLLYVGLGGLWTFTVLTYGRTIRRNAEYDARWKGLHPPRGAWAEYDGERFPNLPTSYVGIANGREVYEIMLPKAARPDAFGAEVLFGQTEMIVAVDGEVIQ